MAVEHVRFTMNISSGNAAMVDEPRAEVARALRRAANQIEGGDNPEGDSNYIYDYNGNRAGEWSLDIEDDGEDE